MRPLPGTVLHFSEDPTIGEFVPRVAPTSSDPHAGIELRLVSSLWPWWDAVIASTVGFSGIRLRNARAQ